jgi:hypothetical protein
MERRPPPRRRLRRAARAGIVVAISVTVVIAVLWALQRSLIYLPDQSAPPPVRQVLPGGRELTLTTDDGLELRAWFLPAAPEANRDLAVLYAPGNGGHRAGRAPIANELSSRGFSVLLLEYRGYGGNPGSPSEDGLAADAEAAVRALEEQGFPPERTIYVGESLGAGVVARLQASRSPAGVLLRSPFTDLAAVGSHHYPFLPVGLLLRDRFPVVEYLSASTVPVTVVYGTADSVVPTELSAQVAESAGNLVEEVPLDGLNHNDPEMVGPPVADAVARLADAVTDG